MRGLERYTPYISLARGVMSSKPNTDLTHPRRPRKITNTMKRILPEKMVPPKARNRALAQSGQFYGFLLAGQARKIVARKQQKDKKPEILRRQLSLKEGMWSLCRVGWRILSNSFLDHLLHFRISVLTLFSLYSLICSRMIAKRMPTKKQSSLPQGRSAIKLYILVLRDESTPTEQLVKLQRRMKSSKFSIKSATPKESSVAFRYLPQATTIGGISKNSWRSKHMYQFQKKQPQS